MGVLAKGVMISIEALADHGSNHGINTERKKVITIL